MDWILIAALLSPLIDDRPPVEDLQRFPAAAICDEQIAAADRYWTHLQARLEWEPLNYWRLSTVAAEAAELRRAWSALRDACVHSHPDWQREALRTLRERIGPEAYYAGRMPPCVPVWRFEWRD